MDKAKLLELIETALDTARDTDSGASAWAMERAETAEQALLTYVEENLA